MVQARLGFFSKMLIAVGLLIIVSLPAYPVIYAAFFLYSTLSRGIFLAILAPLIMISYISYVAIFAAETSLILSAVKTKNYEGVFKTSEVNRALFYYSCSSAFTTMLSKLLSLVLVHSSVLDELIFKAYGGRLGKNCLIGSFILNPYLIELGNNCVVGKNSILSAHFIIGNRITIKKIKVGNNVTIGAGSIIAPGVVIEDNVTVKVKSVVMPDSVLKKNGIYSGNPARLERMVSSSKKK